MTVGLYKQRVRRFATAVGIERTTNRGEHARARQNTARLQEKTEDGLRTVVLR
ncbi:hypothetical protein [Azoarcus sp. KH32C]|uniref:hypothetical protein n=1 Tax=Azoarcus sp. KH32C TaxID=748247 RepID=UPI0012EA6416|nr:hypothetical protein [Azoarcus sp. KH32C]